MKKNYISALAVLACVAVFCTISGNSFHQMRTATEEIIPGEGVTEVRMLSDYFPDLAGTAGDTQIYVLQGEQEGGSCLILGGTHANELGGHMGAVLFVENAKVEAGTLYVIPRPNNSAFTHNDPQEGHPSTVHITTDEGNVREFIHGSRATNPVDQWPDPDVYVNYMGQSLSGSENRNINRTYPGKADGTLTEMMSYGIVQLINTENIDVTVDLHEASPEYPVINALIAHERAMNLASNVVVDMQMEGVQISLEPSPTDLRGLTHRELGDHTDTLALLMEAPNPAQGRLRDRTDEALVLTGKSETYVKAGEIGQLYVPYDENGWPIEVRCARHVFGIERILANYSEMYEEPIIVTGMPSYDELVKNGMGPYLNEPTT